MVETSYDLSWLWNTLNSISATLTSWFSGISSTLTSITNTGQGLFTGLASLASALWDAITKFATIFGQWIGTAFNWIYQGLVAFAATFGQWVNSAFSFIAQGLTWVGSQLYNFGQWIWNSLYSIGTWLYNGIAYIGDQLYNFGQWAYNGLVYIQSWIISAAEGLWSAVTTWFATIASDISTFWNSVIGSVNTWFMTIITTFRSKIISTITADIAITQGWKAAERLTNIQDIPDVIFGVAGLLTAPFVGMILGSIVDAVLPIPHTTTYPVIPDIGVPSITIPSIAISTPTIPSAPVYPTARTPPLSPTLPTPPVTGAPTGPFTGLGDFFGNITASYDDRWDAGNDKTATIISSYTVSVA